MMAFYFRDIITPYYVTRRLERHAMPDDADTHARRGHAGPLLRQLTRGH